MRIEFDGKPWIDQADPDNPEKFIFAEDVEHVFCEGMEIKFVTAFDDQEGWVEFLARDAQDKFIIDGDHARKDRLEGKITFTLRERRKHERP